MTDPAAYGDTFADVYDDWYGDVSGVEATADVVADLAAGGPVLELGIGTGRLALPIASRGVEVHGIDASAAMVERLRAKPGGDRIAVTVADFTDVPASVPGGFAVVLVAYNTLFNLASEEAQRRCLAASTRRLRPGGAVIVEAFVPDPDAPQAGADVKRATAEGLLANVYRRRPGTQVVDGAVVHFSAAGTVVRPWSIRWSTPEQLDGMAAEAGLQLEHRWAGWDRQPFDADSDRHVTVWRHPAGDAG